MQTATTSNVNFTLRRFYIWFIVDILFSFQIHRGSSSQYLRFAEPVIPSYSVGNGFARGFIDFGGLKVAQAQVYTKIWSINEGGYDDWGISFYEPAMLTEGYHLLGHLSHPNSRPQHVATLVAQDTSGDPYNATLVEPLDYALIWSSVGVTMSKDGEGYIWLPTAPLGYQPVGLVVTTSPNPPPVDLIRVVRADLTASLEVDQMVWSKDRLKLYTTRPIDKGVKSLSVPVGTFMAITGAYSQTTLACLKRSQPDDSSMPTIDQVQLMVQSYAPVVYFHPKEEFLPASVEWLFENGALLYHKGASSGEPVRAHGWNLPIKGSVDDYYIDLPSDETARDRVKRGDLQNAKAYVRVRPNFGATYTDLVVWLFYPFNGPGELQIGSAKVKFKKWGEHVGDWEHFTLRVDNFNGALKTIYLSQHDKGTWVSAMEFEFEEAGGKPVVYSSLHGHAHYSSAGSNLHAGKRLSIPLPFDPKELNFGIMDYTGKGNNVMNIRTQYEILQADANTLLRQQWLFYPGRWGPKIRYKTEHDINQSTSFLSRKWKEKTRKLLMHLPAEVFGEEGPQGPMMKDSWDGDERI